MLPAWAWSLISIACFAIASFIAFHRERVAHDKAANELRLSIKEMKQRLGDTDRFEAEYTMFERLKEQALSLRSLDQQFPQIDELWDMEEGEEMKASLIKNLNSWYQNTLKRLTEYREDWGQHFRRNFGDTIETSMIDSPQSFRMVLDRLLHRLDSLQGTIRRPQD